MYLVAFLFAEAVYQGGFSYRVRKTPKSKMKKKKFIIFIKIFAIVSTGKKSLEGCCLCSWRWA